MREPPVHQVHDAFHVGPELGAGLYSLEVVIQKTFKPKDGAIKADETYKNGLKDKKANLT